MKPRKGETAMHLFSPETRAARAELRTARERLAEVSAASREETDEYLDANHAVIEAERPLKWWQRFDIDHTVG